MKKNHDSDMPVGKIRVVKDFLPPPEVLFVGVDEKVRVNIYLSKASIQYFKKQAQKHHTKYQKVIRELLDSYVMQHHAA